MFIEAKQIEKWKKTKLPHPQVPCSLCGRKIDTDEACLTALWRAQAGHYIQTYHPECARVVKLWGFLDDFLSPRTAESWAVSLSCIQCKERVLCSRYVFRCEKAMNAIRLLGGTGSGQDSEKDEE